MRRVILPLLCVLTSLTFAAPPAAACVVYSTGSETTTYSMTLNAGDDAVTVGVHVTQEKHQGSENVCIFVAPVATLASTQVTPFVVLP